MKRVIVSLKSISPGHVQGKYHEAEKLPRELNADYEKRTWREKSHVDNKGFIIIPGLMFKNALAGAAKYISMQIPGKGKQTFTKHFEAGLMVPGQINTDVKKEKMDYLQLFVPSDGKRGGTKRVMKYFPIIHEWEGDLEVLILDEIITKEAFIKHLTCAGQFIGVGSFRPRNNGMYGRFTFDEKDVKWDI
jgi:hypothetical protein